ncbi:hypothetical protein F4677DRAFT_451469 [Hypoxylon crocopeplum]|nr:hypothetical protein F4677DRAFT_451469 [Hypoxylon crocopeplum]
MGGGTLARQLIQKGNRVLLIEKGGLEYSTHVLNTSRPHYDHESQDPSTPGRDNELVYQQARIPWAIKHGSTPGEIGGGAINVLGGRSLMWSLETPEINLKNTPAEMSFPDSVVKYLAGEGFEKALRLMASSPPSNPFYPNEQIGTAEKDSLDRLSVDSATSRLEKALDKYWLKYHQESHEKPFLITNGAEYATQQELYYFPQGAYSTADYLLDRLYAQDPNLTVLANYEVISFKRKDPISSENKVDLRSISLLSADGKSEKIDLSTPETIVILCAGTVDSAAIALRSGLKDVRIDLGQNPTQPSLTLRGSPSGPASDVPSDLPSTSFPHDTSDLSSRSVHLSPDRYPGLLIGKGLTEHEIRATRFWDPDCVSKLPVELCNRNVEINSKPSLLTICTQAESFYRHGFATGNSDTPTKKGNALNVMFEFETRLDESSCVTIGSNSQPLLDLQRKPLDESEKFQDALGYLAQCLYDSFDMPKDAEPPKPVLRKFGAVAHEVGTMRMGVKQGKSVVDENLKVHFVNNLYVCDLSVFPYSPMANPSLTLVALAIRLADYLSSQPVY